MYVDYFNIYVARHWQGAGRDDRGSGWGDDHICMYAYINPSIHIICVCVHIYIYTYIYILCIL